VREPGELESWKRISRGLKTRSDPEERELTLARAKIGELMMRLKLAETSSTKRGLADEPECNGVIERFMRTLKEQCLYLHRFQNLAEAYRLIAEFITRYNTEWLIERLGYQTPVAARAAAMAA